MQHNVLSTWHASFSVHYNKWIPAVGRCVTAIAWVLGSETDATAAAQRAGLPGMQQLLLHMQTARQHELAYVAHGHACLGHWHWARAPVSSVGCHAVDRACTARRARANASMHGTATGVYQCTSGWHRGVDCCYAWGLGWMAGCMHSWLLPARARAVAPLRATNGIGDSLPSHPPTHTPTLMCASAARGVGGTCTCGGHPVPQR